MATPCVWLCRRSLHLLPLILTIVLLPLGAQVEFSPFVENLIAVGTAQYFGIVGNGRQYIYEMLPSGAMAPVRPLLQHHCMALSASGNDSCL